MQSPTSTVALLLALSFGLFACGKDSKKKNDASTPAPGPDYSFVPDDSNSYYPDDHNCSQSQTGCDDDDTNQPRLNVVTLESWSYTNSGQVNRNQSGEACVQSLIASSGKVDLKLRNMDLRRENNGSGYAARCLMEAKVRYPKGWAFAIRRVNVKVDSNLRSGSTANFAGSYAIRGQRSVEFNRSINKQGSQTSSLETSVNNRDYAWSSCDGEGTLSFNTDLGINGNAANNSSLAVSSQSPYRIEIVWAKCS